MLKTRVKQLETYTDNLNTKIDFVNQHSADKTECEKIKEKIEKQEIVIKNLIELCQPILLEKMADIVGGIACGIEKEIRSISKNSAKKENKKTNTKKTSKIKTKKESK